MQRAAVAARALRSAARSSLLQRAQLCTAHVAPMHAAIAQPSAASSATRTHTLSRSFSSSASSSSDAAASTAAEPAVAAAYAPSGPASPVALSCLEFPYMRIDPADPSSGGRDYSRGTSVRDAPLLVLHGLLGSAGNWRTIAPKLTTRRRLLSLDVRNHGASPHVADMRFASCAADVLALMDARGIDKAIVLGHSLGGKIAMAAALLHPDRIVGVIPVDMAPATYKLGEQGWSGVASIVAACAATPLHTMRSRAGVDAHLKPFIPDYTTRSFVLQNAVVSTVPASAAEAAESGGSGQVQRVNWRCNIPVLAQALPHIARFDLGAEHHMVLPSDAPAHPPPPAPHTPAPFPGPALFVGGGLSHYITPRQHDAIHALFPRAEIRSVPGAGHWVHAEKPAEFVATVAPWLRQLEEMPDGTEQGQQQA